MDPVIVIGLAGTVSGVIFGYAGYKKGLKTENVDQGKESGTIRADTRYIIRRVDDILLEQKDTNKSINLLNERVTRVEESTKQAHKRLDHLK